MATEFTATVKSSGGDYTTWNAALAGLINNLTLATIKVFAISAASSPTIAAGDAVTEVTSLATGVCVLVNAARTQILIKTIAGGTFNSGDVVKKTTDPAVTVTLADNGDSPIAGIALYSMTDTTAVATGSWTTGASNYIRCYTPSSERHAGVWDSSKYNLSIAGAVNAITITGASTKFLRIEGIQASMDSPGVGATIYRFGAISGADIRIGYSIGRALAVNGFGASTSSDINTVTWYNCIHYDLTWGWTSNTTTANYTWYNCTAYNCTQAWQKQGGGGTWTAVNCLSASNTTGFNATWTASDYNASTNASATGGAHDRVSQTFTFVDATNRNLQLAATDAGARDFGTTDPGSGLFSDDIVGNARPYGSAWDIGASEYSVSGTTSAESFQPFVQPVTQNTYVMT